MTGQDLKNMFVAFVLVAGAVAFGEQGTLSPEEDLELNRQLILLNRPAVKSFRTEYGDIFDCVEISKQPAFSHPLLKNHTLQMKPSTIPTGSRGDNSTGETWSQYFVDINRCPEISVPIRRTTKEDLIAAKNMKPPRPFHSMASPDITIDVKGHHFAVLNYVGRNLGARSQINVWQPGVKNDQSSVASMWLGEGTRYEENSVQAGWGVIPQLSRGQSTLNVYWTADGFQTTGCYNLLCPGFVQISREITPGIAVKPISAYNGPQYDIPISIHQDSATGNWLFMFGTKYIGYWPKLLVPGLGGGATFVSWGGKVYSPTAEPSPAMGSGHFPEEGFRKAAYVNQIQVATAGPSFDDPDATLLSVGSTSPICYSAIQDFTTSGNWGRFIYFGGPGNCVFK